MKNILLTGGAGYIGSHAARLLIKKKYNVVIIDNLSTGSKKLLPDKAKFYNLDIKDYVSLDKVFSKHKFSSIMHFAGCLSVPESQLNPKKYYLNNVFGTQVLLDLTKKYGLKNFIFSSTCAVYGGVRGSVTEKTLKNPESYYGKTKDICEELIKSYSIRSKFQYVILRYFNVVGASHDQSSGQLNSQSLFKNLCKNIVSKKNTISVFGKSYKTKDGTCIRDYIDVNDLVNLHYLSLINQKSKNKVINCGYNKGYSVLDIIKNFELVIQKKIKIKFKSKRLGDVESIYASNKLMTKIFGKWKRNFSLKDSIKNALEWEYKNRVSKNNY